MTGSLVSTLTIPNIDSCVNKPLSSVQVRGALIQIHPRKNKTQWTEDSFLSKLNGGIKIEIHYNGEVFFWKYLDHYQSGSVINLCLRLIAVKKSIENSAVDIPEVLLDVSESYVIKEDGWDLVWFSFDGGHMVFYFDRP